MEREGVRGGGWIANTMCFQEFFTLRPSLQWLGLGVPGLLLWREPSWTGCQVACCSYLATCKYVWYIDDVCTHCMLNSKWTEQAWEPWSSSLSLVTLPSTLAGRRSSMSQGEPFQNHFFLTTFERVSSLVWVVLWFLLVADSPDTVGVQILVFFLLRSQVFSTGIYLLRRRNTSWSP